MPGVVDIIDAMVDLIQKNIIAKTNVVSNAIAGDVLVNVENSFYFEPEQEVVLIDWGYNDETSPHYNKFEYSKIKEVNNTNWITLDSPIVDPYGGWLVSNNAFIQKTIGHSPLYEQNVMYGDREIIPTDSMAVTVEPISNATEWMYIQGGLSNEYRVGIMVYGKNIDTPEGMKILNKYTDAISLLFNKNIHLDVTNYKALLLENIAAGTYLAVIEDTPKNREMFVVSTALPDQIVFDIQDNRATEIDRYCYSVSTPGDGRMYITLGTRFQNLPFTYNYLTSEYAVLMRHGRYLWDSRVDGTEYGTVQKGSAYVRAAKLTWFGKEIEEYRFPQQSRRITQFTAIEDVNSSSSSSSSS